MSKVKCLISSTNDPWLNLATEDWVFNKMGDDEHILMFWRNEKSVIIGRNQNPWSECNVDNLKSDNVNLVRRQSGGGAVFQDLGNSIFSFLSSSDSHDKKRNFQIIVSALKKFGIDAVQEGRNDILVNGKKVSGSAFRERNGKSFHHGTLLIDVNLSELGSYLTPSQKKLIAKGTSSVRSRVANLTEFNDSINHDVLSEAIIDEFFRVHNTQKNIEILDNESLKRIPELKEFYDEMKSSEWCFGLTPNFDHNLEEKFDWGLVDVHLNVDSCKITDSKIFSDSLDPKFIDSLNKALQGVGYDKVSIQNAMGDLMQELSDQKDKILEFSNWLCEEI